MKPVPVDITWQIDPPPDRRYITVVRFSDDPLPWETAEGWSLVVMNSDDGWTARFLSDAAPHDKLAPGKTFELYEGFKRSATGRVLHSRNGENTANS